MLCLACQNIFLAKRTLDHRWSESNQATSLASHDNFKPRRPQDLDDEKKPRYIHHVSISEFFRASKQGCQLCLMLLSQLRPEDKSDLARPPREIDASLVSEDYPITYSIYGGYGFTHGKKLVKDAWHLRIHYMYPISAAGQVREISSRVDFINAPGMSIKRRQLHQSHKIN